jgi:hypothetical protein
MSGMGKCIGALLVVSCVCGQTAGVTYYGVTCGPQPPAGSPRILVQDLPKLGRLVRVSQVGVQVQSLPGCRHYGGEWLALGGSRNQAWGIPLPWGIPLQLTGGFQCVLWSSADFVGPGGGLGGGQAFVIPNDPGLLGAHAYLQWFVYYRNDGAFCWPYYERWMTSDCADLLIGN